MSRDFFRYGYGIGIKKPAILGSIAGMRIDISYLKESKNHVKNFGILYHFLLIFIMR